MSRARICCQTGEEGIIRAPIEMRGGRNCRDRSWQGRSAGADETPLERASCRINLETNPLELLPDIS